MSSIDRRRILAGDPRCKWMFQRFPAVAQTRPKTLEALVKAVKNLEPTSAIINDLENIRDFLNHAETLNLNEEVEDILYSIGLDAETVALVSDHAGLLTTSSLFNDAKKSLPLEIRRALLTCKGAWGPTIFAHVRQYPELFFGEAGGASAESALPPTLKERVVSQSQAQRLRRFFGIRHAEPVLPIQGEDRDSEGPHLSVTVEVPSSSVSGPIESPEIRKEEEPQLPKSVESEQVRSIVQSVIEQNDMRLGVISVALVLSKAQDSGVALTKDRLMAMIPRLDSIVMLDDDWLGRTRIREVDKRLFTEQLAAQILSVVDQVPVDILHAQIGRSNPTYKAMTTDAISSYFDAHPGFRLQGELVRAAKSFRYTASTENSLLENNLWRAMSKVIFPLDVTAIDARYKGRPALKPGPRDRALRSSPIFAKTEDGYFALTDSSDLHALIRAESEFITPFSNAEEDIEEVEDLIFAENEDEDLTFVENEDEVEQWQPDEEVTVTPAETASATTEPPMVAEEPRHFGETRTEALTIREIVSQVLNSQLQIPEIQRSYVWKTTQVRDLFDSLYNGYPIGTLLVWETQERLKGKRIGSANYFDNRKGGSTRFLLDGQQRTTSIVNAFEGSGPRLYFNALDEHGAFRTSRAHLSISARSIPIAGLESESVDSLLRKIKIGSTDPSYAAVRRRLEHLVGMLDRRVSVETLHGFDYGEATDVFIRVNSRGTKLKNAELAIAHLAYRLPGTVGGEIQQLSDKLSARGWDFPVPFLIRLITATATRRVGYGGLNAVEDEAITESWHGVRAATLWWIDQLQIHLGITSEDILVGKNSHIIPITWMATHSRDECSQRLMYWFVLSAVFSRYSGTTDTNLDQDLRHITISDEREMVEHLLAPLRARRASLRVEPLEIERAGRQSALRVLMYLADLQVATSNLFAPDRVADVQHPPIAAPIFSSKLLRALGFEPGDRWAKDGGLVNSLFIDPAFDSDDLIKAARALRQESRYQHALPVISVYQTRDQLMEFFAQRSRLLVDHFNDVLNALDSEILAVRPVERPSQAIGRGRRELNFSNIPFDHTRRLMYDTIRKRILELDPSVIEIETDVYIGFTHGKSQRPFATIAKRKSILNFAVDVDINEIHDPKGICRDVTSVSKHGIGNTGFAIKRMDEVHAVLNIIEQIMDIRT